MKVKISAYRSTSLAISTTTTGFGTIGGALSHRGRRNGNHFIGTGFFTTGTVPVSTNHTLPLFNMSIDPNRVALNQTVAANCPIVGMYGNSALSAMTELQDVRDYNPIGSLTLLVNYSEEE
jgi:hypothetical protein